MPANAGIPLLDRRVEFFDTRQLRDEKFPAVCIMADRYRGTVYVDVTSDLYRRVWDHKNKTTPGFTSKYGLKKLVWYAHYTTMHIAIRREKQIKAWKREWKIKIIELLNPEWADLHEQIDPVSTLVEPEAGPQHSLG